MFPLIYNNFWCSRSNLLFAAVAVFTQGKTFHTHTHEQISTRRLSVTESTGSVRLHLALSARCDSSQSRGGLNKNRGCDWLRRQAGGVCAAEAERSESDPSRGASSRLLMGREGEAATMRAKEAWRMREKQPESGKKKKEWSRSLTGWMFVREMSFSLITQA